MLTKPRSSSSLYSHQPSAISRRASSGSLSQQYSHQLINLPPPPPPQQQEDSINLSALWDHFPPPTPPSPPPPLPSTSYTHNTPEELLRDDMLLSIKSSSPIPNPSKRLIPPPLDLTRSIPSPSSSSIALPATIPADPKRPGTPLSNAFSSDDSTSTDHLPAPTLPSSLTPTPTTCNNTSYPKPTSANHLLTKPVEEDLAIEDEERQAAEWMGSCSNTWNNSDASFNHDFVHRILSPIPLVSNQPQEEDGGLTTMEKIFLFAKSENSHHRVVVSQRLPELLEEVDITEAVEYVLPLLSGLTQDDDMIREALAPTFGNIMWYYLSRCPLIDIEDDPSNSLKSSVGVDWPPEEPLRRPQISLSSFTTSLITLLTDPDCSISLLTRYGFLVFLCRLVNSPLPDWSEDLKLLSGEPFLPVEYHGLNRQDQYEEYTFDESIRTKIAFQLVESIIDELCGPQQLSSHAKLDQNDSNESDEWDTVPLNGDESERTPSTYHALNHSSHHLLATPTSCFDPSLSQYSNFRPTDSLDQLHRQQIGLILIESIAQARCLDPSFMYHKLLPKLIHGNVVDQNCRALRQQAASTLTTLMISLSAPLVTPSYTHERSVEISEESENVLVDSYRSFASDLDPEVRKQIVLGLPALLKLVHHRSRAELSLDLMEQFSRDENREVRIVGCQILGELIYVFHLENSKVPDQLVDCFLSGFENNYSNEPIHGELERTSMTHGPDLFGGQTIYFDQATSSSPGPLNQFTDLTQDPHRAPPTSSSFGTPGLSAEHTERAMCCSYNFPAVLFTLGVERWEELRKVFLKLATDVSYPPKIRRSLARSMHELIKLITAPPNKLSVTTRLRSLATQDWIKVLKFFLFDDPEVSNTESVLETLDVSFSHINLSLTSLPDSQQIVIVLLEIIDKLSDYFVHDDNMNHQTLFILDQRRRITWTLRERVLLLLPKLSSNLQSYDSNDSHLAKELERCFETLLFLGLHDPAAAVREAALEFVPIFFGSNTKPKSKNQEDQTREEFQRKMIEKLKLLSFNSNYRVRMNYPKSISNLIKNQTVSLDFFEKEILKPHYDQLIELSKDKVSGVRISLARLMNQLCHSKHFYYYHFFNHPPHPPNLPGIFKRIMFVLSNDSESIVRSFLDRLIDKIQLDPEPKHEDRVQQEEERKSVGYVEKGVNLNTTKQSTKQPNHNINKEQDKKSWIRNSNNEVRFSEDDDSDDLSGSGIKVEQDDETRLSEDEGVQIGLAGEDVDFFNSSSSSSSEEEGERSIRQNQKGKKVDGLCCSSITHHRHQLRGDEHQQYSSIFSTPFVKLNHQIISSTSGSRSYLEDEEDDDEDDDVVAGPSSSNNLINHSSRLTNPSSLIRVSNSNNYQTHNTRIESTIRRSISEPAPSSSSTTATVTAIPTNCSWDLNSSSSSSSSTTTTTSRDKPHPPFPLNPSPPSSTTNNTNQDSDLLTTSSSSHSNSRRRRRGRRKSTGDNSSPHYLYNLPIIPSTSTTTTTRLPHILNHHHHHGSLVAAGPGPGPGLAGNSNIVNGDQIWMRDTDGGFVEVGEY